MKRKIIFPSAVLAAALLLGAGTWMLQRAEDEQPAAETLSAASLEGAITRITYNAGDSGELVDLVCADGVWQWAQDAEYPLAQSYAQTMQTYLGEVSATALVMEACSDFSPYGLDAPQKTVTAQTQDGAELTLFFGDQNSHTGDYYLRVNGDSALYTVSSTLFASFNHTLYSMAANESWPADGSPSVTALSYESENNTFSLCSRTEQTTGDDDETQDLTIYTYSSGEDSFDTTDASAASLLSEAGGLTFASLVSYKPDEEALAGFGLNIPDAVLTVEFEGSEGTDSRTLLIGGMNDGGYYYVMIDGSDCIYTVDNSTIGEFILFSGSILPVYEPSDAD